MAKNLRFAELVKKCGQPKTETLWTKPKTNAALQKAIRQNRVLTILKKPHKKDFGLIGFEYHQSAVYLIFPKSLPKLQSGAQVIGIKYELLRESLTDKYSSVSKSRLTEKNSETTSKLTPIHFLDEETLTPKPQPKNFLVTVARAATLETQISVTALNKESAETQALEKVKRQKFLPKNVHDEVKTIVESK